MLILSMSKLGVSSAIFSYNYVNLINVLIRIIKKHSRLKK